MAQAVKCPKLTFEIVRNLGAIRITALYPNRQRAGQILVKGNTVAYIRTSASLRRCGLGTQLYTRVAQELCKEGRGLVSDTTRTDAAEGFWRKQVRKNRAECLPGRGERLSYSDKTGFTRTQNYWACRKYKLKCPVTSLRGRR